MWYVVGALGILGGLFYLLWLLRGKQIKVLRLELHHAEARIRALISIQKLERDLVAATGVKKKRAKERLDAALKALDELKPGDSSNPFS